MDCILSRVVGHRELVHAFFWAAYGQSTAHHPLGKRFTRFVRALLGVCDNQSLMQDALWMESLAQVASNEARKSDLASLLRPLELVNPARCLPTSIEHEITGLDTQRCKTLQSNAAPLFLHFKCIDTMPDMIFKVGDDVRQDEFCLLLGALMKVTQSQNSASFYRFAEWRFLLL
jgi:hypothetical protein